MVAPGLYTQTTECVIQTGVSALTSKLLAEARSKYQWPQEGNTLRQHSKCPTNQGRNWNICTSQDAIWRMKTAHRAGEKFWKPYTVNLHSHRIPYLGTIFLAKIHLCLQNGSQVICRHRQSQQRLNEQGDALPSCHTEIAKGWRQWSLGSSHREQRMDVDLVGLRASYLTLQLRIILLNLISLCKINMLQKRRGL